MPRCHCTHNHISNENTHKQNSQNIRLKNKYIYVEKAGLALSLYRLCVHCRWIGVCVLSTSRAVLSSEKGGVQTNWLNTISMKAAATDNLVFVFFFLYSIHLTCYGNERWVDGTQDTYRTKKCHSLLFFDLQTFSTRSAFTQIASRKKKPEWHASSMLLFILGDIQLCLSSHLLAYFLSLYIFYTYRMSCWNWIMYILKLIPDILTWSYEDLREEYSRKLFLKPFSICSLRFLGNLKYLLQAISRFC